MHITHPAIAFVPPGDVNIIIDGENRVLVRREPGDPWFAIGMKAEPKVVEKIIEKPGENIYIPMTVPEMFQGISRAFADLQARMEQSEIDICRIGDKVTEREIKTDEWDLDGAIDKWMTNNFDIDDYKSQIREIAEREIEDFDFDDKLREALDDYDFEDNVKTIVQEMDFDITVR